MSDPESPTDKPSVPPIDSTESSSSGEELPPLPDGGLSSAMPTWLQQAPSRPARSRAPETVDVTSLTAGVELPAWLQELSKRVEGVVIPVEPPPTPAEIIEGAGVMVGERELIATESAIEPETPVTEADSPAPPDARPPAGPQEPVHEPAPVRSFQVRSENRPPQLSSQGGSTQGAPLRQRGGGEGLVPSHGQRSSGRVSDIRFPQAPVPEQPRSMGATVLLVLLLVALAVLGVWYYWW